MISSEYSGSRKSLPISVGKTLDFFSLARAIECKYCRSSQNEFEIPEGRISGTEERML